MGSSIFSHLVRGVGGGAVGGGPCLDEVADSAGNWSRWGYIMAVGMREEKGVALRALGLILHPEALGWRPPPPSWALLPGYPISHTFPPSPLQGSHLSLYRQGPLRFDLHLGTYRLILLADLAQVPLPSVEVKTAAAAPEPAPVSLDGGGFGIKVQLQGGREGGDWVQPCLGSFTARASAAGWRWL